VKRNKSGHETQDTRPNAFPECAKKKQNNAKDQNGQRGTITVENSGRKGHDIPDRRDKK
jgi:hypothetical protein